MLTSAGNYFRIQILTLIIVTFGVSILCGVNADQELSPLIEKGKTLIESGDYESALVLYDNLIFTNPYNASFYNNKGVVQYRLGRCDESVKTLESARSLDPDDINILMNLVFSEVCIGNFTKAEELLDDGMKNYQNHAGLWLARGIIKRQKGDLTGAISDINHSIRLEPKNPELWYEYAKSTALTGDIDEALQQILVAENLSSNDTAIMYYHGVLEEQKGLFRDAIATYDRVISSDPNNTWAWFSKGSIYWNHYRLNESIASYEKVIALDPNMSKAWFFRGLAYKELQQYNISGSSFERAALLEPDNKYYRAYYDRYTSYSGESSEWVEKRAILSAFFVLLSLFMIIGALFGLRRIK